MVYGKNSVHEKWYEIKNKNTNSKMKRNEENQN